MAVTEQRTTRVLLCTSGGLFGALVLRRLLASPRVAVTGLVRSTRVMHPDQGRLGGVLALLGRSGLRYTLYLGFATGLADALGRWSGLMSVARAARLHQLPVLATSDMNRSPGLDFIGRHRPDLMVSAFFNQRIGEVASAVPRLGTVNIHPSLLPDYKGVDPVFHARLRGEEAYGVTVHRVAPELDTGALLAQTEVSLDPGASVLAATALLFDRGARLLLDRLTDVLDETAGQPQPPGGSYDSWPSPDAVRQFRRSGNCLLRLTDLRLFKQDAWRGPA